MSLLLAGAMAAAGAGGRLAATAGAAGAIPGGIGIPAGIGIVSGARQHGHAQGVAFEQRDDEPPVIQLRLMFRRFI